MLALMKDARIQNAEQKQLAIVGFCFDGNSSFMKGAAEAPPLIRAAFQSDAANLWSESGLDLGAASIFFAGDVAPAPDEEMNACIERAVSALLARNLAPISLGGDHSITVPIIRAFAREYPDLSILHFDAHPDLYDELAGNRYSHACPFARIMEEKLVQRLVQVGIRTMNGHQREQAEKFGVEVYEMKDWRDDLVFDFDSPVYISFDLDGLDPAFAPGVSHREPGGLSTRQAIGAIQNLKGHVVGADIVEFNPRMDPLNLTATVCAKLLKEIAARMIEL
jgi:agmatinase